jgi:surface antigen
LHIHRIGLLASILVLLALTPLPGHAMWGWMTGAAVTDFNAQDWEILKREAQRALETVDSGVRVNWQNDASGNSGAIKPLMDFTHNGMTCRRVAFLTVTRKGMRGVANYNLCRQPDGEWGFVSDSEIAR